MVARDDRLNCFSPAVYTGRPEHTWGHSVECGKRVYRRRLGRPFSALLRRSL